MPRRKSKKSLRQLVSANIRELRAEQGYSQESFADECGLHRTYIGSVERGERNISIDNIERIANALNIAAYELLKEF